MVQTEKDNWGRVGKDLLRLGRNLKIKSSLQVKGFMREELSLLTVQDSIKAAMDIMVSKNIDAVPIIDQQDLLVGLVTKTLVLRELLAGTDVSRPLGDIMIRKVMAIAPDEDVSSLITINVGNLPVVQNKKVLGRVTLPDTICAYFSSLIALHAEINAIIDSTHNGILTVNENGEIILINKAAEQVLNLKREEVVGVHISTLLPYSNLPQALASGQSSFGQKSFTVTRALFPILRRSWEMTR